jgi:hypothetical protein
MDIDTELTTNVNFDFYRSRLRILFILNFFSKPYRNVNEPNRVKIFETEVRIQKIDFLLRNPDYLAYEILSLIKEGKLKKDGEVKTIVENIFKNNEPIIRKQEMERFFFGAFEDLDDIIAFLKAFGFIEFESEKNVAGKIIGKKYFLTKFGKERISKGISEIPSIEWYEARCELIYRFFGSMSGNELKIRQYQIKKYKDTPLNQYIEGIEDETKNMYQEMYGESLV